VYDYLFTRENGKQVKDFRGSWEKVCNEASLSGLHFHDLRRTAARNMRRGHVSEKVAMEVGGWKTTSVFHRYAIVDNQDVADAMNLLEKSQDEQRQRLERAALARNANGPAATNDCSRANEPETPTTVSDDSLGTSRLHHVEVSREVFQRLHRRTRRAVNAVNYRELSTGAGRGSRTPKGRSPADFESAASASSAIPALIRINRLGRKFLIGFGKMGYLSPKRLHCLMFPLNRGFGMSLRFEPPCSVPKVSLAHNRVTPKH
jgi:Phage integrase family